MAGFIHAAEYAFGGNHCMCGEVKLCRKATAHEASQKNNLTVTYFLPRLSSLNVYGITSAGDLHQAEQGTGTVHIASGAYFSFE